MKNKYKRRDFIKDSFISSIGVGLGSSFVNIPSGSRILGANEKIRMGFIGIGNRGSLLLNLFMQNKYCEVEALCDVYKPYAERKRAKVDKRYFEHIGNKIPMMNEKCDKHPKMYYDYRDLLENKDIDAVCIAAPDHWHALITIEAIQAGKDVYVEKPLTKTIYEGRKMIEAHRVSNQVVAVGLNR